MCNLLTNGFLETFDVALLGSTGACSAAGIKPSDFKPGTYIIKI